MKMMDLIKAVADAYRNPEEGNADKNGNTRLSVLQKRFNLSSLKVQKILVTAGVYEPVKKNTSYDEITRLREQGKDVDEIVEITGFSNATVSACFPYKRPVYNADLNGADVSTNAERKRRQRDKKEEKRINAVEVMQNHLTDESFWKTVQEHGRETFVSADGERYSVYVLVGSTGKRKDSDGEWKDLAGTGEDANIIGKNSVRRWTDPEGTGRRISETRQEELYVRMEAGGTRSFSKEEVLDVLHNAVELKAVQGMTDMASFDQTPALPYVYPILVFFGIVPGDKAGAVTRRGLSGDAVCICCGRRAEYQVGSYRDLIRIAARIEENERSRWDPKERERVERMEASYGRVSWEERARKDSAAIRAFDEEGERWFCTICAETIRMALEDGELPHSSAQADLGALSLEAAEAAFEKNLSVFPEGSRYVDWRGMKYDSGRRDEEEWKLFFCVEKDKDGIEHSFACRAEDLPGHMVFEAVEIHKLTKAGKLARDYTGTDYEFRTGLKEKEAGDEDENLRRIYIGFLELVNKVRDSLLSPSLEWHEGAHYLSNAVMIGHRQCILRSIGQMQVVYVDEQSVQGRDWNGGQYGYMIDGIVFTGEEVALMSSAHEGWNLQYRFADLSDQPLRAGEYLMPVQLGDKELVTEVSELLNLFVVDGKFVSDHDAENFGILFERTVLKKLKLYYESNPRGYGKLAGMEIVKRLGWIEGTERQAEQVRETVQM